jgi:predicted DNA-binding ribbon-helix-helix protein
LVRKRTITINNRKTSVSLEDAFWSALKEVAATQKIALSDLVSSIDLDRQHANLSSVLRVFVLKSYRDRRQSRAPTRPADDH